MIELTDAERGALLDRIGARPEPPSEHALERLQTAWCFAQPFHNLDLLAAVRRDGGALEPAAAVQRCIDGLGGPCHVHSLSFLALLRSLGYRAHLCGACVSHPDDHLLVRVEIGDRAWFCDVGNGQPYLRPFPAEAEHRQEHLGWTVISRPTGDGVAIWRTSPDQPDPRRVYEASATPRRWQDFAVTIKRHHAEPGYGPFVTGLRAVRVGEQVMVTLRDNVLTRYRGASFERKTVEMGGLARCLHDDLGLGGLPIEEALGAWAP